MFCPFRILSVLRPHRQSFVSTNECVPSAHAGRDIQHTSSAIGPRLRVTTVHDLRPGLAERTHAGSFHFRAYQSNSRPSIVPSATIQASRSSGGRLNATSKGTPFLIRYRQSIRSGCLLSFPRLVSRRPSQLRLWRQMRRLRPQFLRHRAARPSPRSAAHSSAAAPAHRRLQPPSTPA